MMYPQYLVRLMTLIATQEVIKTKVPPTPQEMPPLTKAVSARNAKCPCGSDKKYKVCCRGKK